MSTTKTAYVIRDGREGEQEVTYTLGPVYEDVIVTKGYYFKTGFNPTPTDATFSGTMTVQIGDGATASGTTGAFVYDGTGASAPQFAIPDEMITGQAPRALTMTITHLVFYGEAEAGKVFTTNFSGDANQFSFSIAHGLNNGQLVTLESTTALPAGSLADTLYYIVNKASTTVELALTPGGTPITLTGNGTGTHKLIPYTKVGFFSMMNNPEFSNGKTRLIG